MMLKTAISAAFVFSVSMSLIVPVSLLTQTTSAASRPGPQTATSQSTPQASDRGWPRGISLPNEAQVVVYQPQVASWTDQKHLVAMSAVSYITKGEQKPTLGTIKIESDTSVSLEQRLVKFSSLKLTEANFQTLSSITTRRNHLLVAASITKDFPSRYLAISVHMSSSCLLPLRSKAT